MRFLSKFWIGFALTLILSCSDQEPQMEEEIPTEGTVIEVKPVALSPEDQVKAAKAPAGMVFIKGGCFIMGNEKTQTDEKPEHEVCVGDFYMDKYEVTQARWQKVMGFNPSKIIGDELPVEQVNYFDIQKFIKKSGGQCRLSTEAEWEYAAGIGLQANFFWGNIMDGDYAWYKDNSGKTTHPVGKKFPNQFGLYDMMGNVWEWVDDWYESHYTVREKTNPKGPESGEHKVIRGGSFNSSAGGLRITNRTWIHPKNRVFSKVSTQGGNVNEIYNYIGFRCAQSLRVVKADG